MIGSQNVASEGSSRFAGAQEPECTRQYMRIPSTAGTRTAERSSFAGRSSCRPPQFFGERFEARRFRFDQPKLVQHVAKIGEQLAGPRAGSELSVTAQQAAQMLQMIFHAFERDAMDVDELVVVAVDELALQIQHVSKAAGHARAEIEPAAAEHDDGAGGHVFA